MDPDSVAGAGTDRISAAHSYFVNQLSMWVDDLPAGEEDEYFDALRDTIYEQLLMVVIELQPGGNPQDVDVHESSCGWVRSNP